MEKLLKPGRIIFAIGIIALGIVCFISKDFIVGRPPAWPAGFTVNPALAYISATIMIASALIILLRQKAGYAALVIAALIFFLSILRHIPQFMTDWANSYKSFALFGGALIVAASFFKKYPSMESSPMKGIRSERKGLILAGTLMLAVFFVVCGYAHFKYSGFVDTLIPAYIPFHPFWTYSCGVFLFAAGIGLILPMTRKWAAFLSGVMIAGWFLLLHIPRFIANTSDPSDRMGLCESFTFAGICFVLAALFSEKRSAY